MKNMLYKAKGALALTLAVSICGAQCVPVFAAEALSAAQQGVQVTPVKELTEEEKAALQLPKLTAEEALAKAKKHSPDLREIQDTLDYLDDTLDDIDRSAGGTVTVPNVEYKKWVNDGWQKVVSAVYQAEQGKKQARIGEDLQNLGLEVSVKSYFTSIKSNEDTLSLTKKNAEIAELFGVSKKYDKVLYSALSLLTGSSVKLFDIFDDEALKDVEKKSVSFSSGFDDNANDFQSYLGERFELLEKLKAVYDWAVLADILDGKEYISEAKVAIYEKHKRDLRTLKKYIKIYMPEKKAEIFNISSKDNNYVAYSKHIKTSSGTGVLNSTCTQEEFCAYLKKTLGICKDASYEEMFKEIENSTFMPKQVTKDNGVVPMQVNEKELVAILKNIYRFC